MPRKRKSGEGGLYYDKKRDLWVGVVDIGYTPEGKRKQKRVSSRSQSVARTKLRAVQAEIEATGSPLGNQTVAAWSEYWLEQVCKPKMKPQPWRTYRSVVTTWILPAIGRKNVKDVLPSDLRSIYDNMKSAGKSSSTQLKAHNVMSSMFEEARLQRIVSSNITKSIRPPKAAKSTRGTLSPDETLRILQAASQHYDGSKWLVSLYGGIRQGERLGAKTDSIDLEGGTFTVRWNLVEANYEHGCGGVCGKKAGGHCPVKRLVIPEVSEYELLKGRYMLVPPKSNESRTFPLTGPLVDVLDRHLAMLEQQPNPFKLLWPDANGMPINGRDDQALWKALLIEAGVDNPTATTHWARHTAISDFSALGVSDRTIGEFVGHKSPGVTGRYQHVSSQDAVDAMKKLEQRRQLTE